MDPSRKRMTVRPTMMRRKDNAMKIVLEGAPGNETERRTATLRNAYPAAEFVVASTGEEQIEQIRDADAYYGWPAREVFVAAERLRWVHCPGTGIDQITKIPELIESDVVVTNTKGPHVAPMADHVMGMIVMLAHRWRELMEDQRLHRWETGKYHNTYLQLEGSTMGILAVGDIGAAVARRAHGFGMNIYAVESSRTTSPRSGKSGARSASTNCSGFPTGSSSPLRSTSSPATSLKSDGRSGARSSLDELLRTFPTGSVVTEAPLTSAPATSIGRQDTYTSVDARRLGLMKKGSRPSDRLI